MFKIFSKLFKTDPLILTPYRTYGTKNHLYIIGRALEDEKLKIVEDQSIFKTIKNTYKQLETDEIPDVDIDFYITKDLPLFTRKTDARGYFKVDETIDTNILKYADEQGWVNYFASYKDEIEGRKIKDGNRFPGEFLIPPDTAEYGIISDIDDTILHTGVTSFLKWRVLHNSLLKNVYDRIALEGAPNFYQQLHNGNNNSQNPLFYLSNSPWNLYQYLELFLDSNEFPKGAILLRNLPNPFRRSSKTEKPHKQKEIINLLKAYPELKFILIGDSGEHDPTIYTDIAVQYPDRILAIYLRSVKHKRRMQRVQSIVDNFKTTPVLLVNKSIEAENHAREHGFIK